MLRNVESFWCPIRFASDKKCANCAIDFPDINGGWVPAPPHPNATMANVVQTWEQQYTASPHLPANGERQSFPWFGHPARQTRLTIEGKQPGVASPTPD